MSSPKIGGPNEPFHDRVREYLDRVARDCVQFRDDICRQIKAKCGNQAQAEEIADITIERVIRYSIHHGLTKEIINVPAFCMKTAYNVLSDVNSGKLKTVGFDDNQNVNLLNRLSDSSAQQLQERLELDETINIALKDATDEQKLIFKMCQAGLNHKEIAEKLYIKPRAAEYQVKKLRALVLTALNARAR